MAAEEQRPDGGDRRDMARSIAVVVAALRDRCREDAALQEAVRHLGRQLLNMVDGQPVPVARPAQPPVLPEPLAERTLRVGGAEMRVRIHPGQSPSDVPVHGMPLEVVAPPPIRGPVVVEQRPEPTQPDLGLIARRSRLKGEACRWAAARRRRVEEGADFRAAVAPTDREFFDRANATVRCYLWMLDPYGPIVPADDVLGVVESCYENLSSAADLVRDVLHAEEDGEENVQVEDAVRLLAEAQSALRVIVTEIGLKFDQDQVDAFHWLKGFTRTQEIYLHRHMRLDDPADPRNWADLQDRLEAFRAEMEANRTRSKRRMELLRRARYHSRRIAEAAVQREAEGLGSPGLEDWQKTFEAINDLVEEGTPPSDLEIRELLLPLIDGIPDGVKVGAGAETALAEVERYLDSREAMVEAGPVQREPSAEVHQAAKLLRDKRVVFIGGLEYPHRRRALEEAFGLSELCWVSTRPHQSLGPFEAEIARADTALVILAIRWSSHSFEGVKEMCDRFCKPFVRLPGGYGVNQVARQVLGQVGLRLGAYA
jgi:hypothetical protein